MKSKPEQFCRIILNCMKRYSNDTALYVGEMLNSHERVFEMEQFIDTNPTEKELLQKLKCMEQNENLDI